MTTLPKLTGVNALAVYLAHEAMDSPEDIMQRHLLSEVHQVARAIAEGRAVVHEVIDPGLDAWNTQQMKAAEEKRLLGVLGAEYIPDPRD